MRILFYKPRLTVWLPALTVMAFAAWYVPFAGRLLENTVTIQTVAASPRPAPARPVRTVMANTAIIPTPAPIAPAVLPHCTPLNFGSASELVLDSTSTGLRIQNDPATYYQIYGNTASDLHTQISQCAPGANGKSIAEYTGETSYSLTWQYSIAVTDTGCSLTDTQVGLHITTALPFWQSTATATPGLDSHWQQFTQALTIHEHGHAQLDANYAGLLLQQLNGLGNLDCGSAADTVQSTVNSVVQALNSANNTYDNQTNHGATQGAVLPN